MYRNIENGQNLSNPNSDRTKETPPPSNPREHRSLLNRQKAKFFSVALSLGLINNNPKSELIKSYWSTYRCNKFLYVGDDGLTSERCKQRWCTVCSRIKTGEQIDQYMPALSALENPQFMTLTAETVDQRMLPHRLDEMRKIFRKISNRRSNRGLFKGVRKLECTYNPKTDSYHPHYHVVIDGLHNAYKFRQQWIEYHKGKARIQANDIRKANKSSLRELCKYATKLSVSMNDNEFHPQALDTIFSALKGKRLIQPFGGIKVRTIKAVRAEHIDEIQANLEYDVEDFGCYQWFQDDGNWISEGRISKGRKLSLYEIEEKLKNSCKKFG
jgi:plasmid rolling circle replication initiator protein Rep